MPTIPETMMQSRPSDLPNLNATQSASQTWRLRGRRLALAAPLALAWLLVSPVQARDWAHEMIKETSFDFGLVARGAKAEHRFVIENNNEEEIRIASATSSCGCTSVQLTKQVLKTWEKAEIIATLDSRSEPGAKDATITVTFGPNFVAEVQIHVHARIRGDVVVQPGAAEFGVLGQGDGGQLKLKLLYAVGRPDWRITAIESADPNIEAEAVETGRTPLQVSYDLAVNLKKNAPAGYIRSQLVLITNDFDPRSSRVPVSVEGLIVAPLSVQPSPLLMGLTEVGRSITRTLVLQGRTPFRVLAVKSSDERFQCAPPTDSAVRHLLPITFLASTAPNGENQVRAKIRIETDLPGVPPTELEASVRIVPPKPKAPSDQTPAPSPGKTPTP